MTDASTANPEDEGIVLSSDGDAAFSSLMDALAPDVDETPAGDGANRRGADFHIGARVVAIVIGIDDMRANAGAYLGGIAG